MVRRVGRHVFRPALRSSTCMASAKGRGSAAEQRRTLCEPSPGRLAEEDRASLIAARACVTDDEHASLLARLRYVDGSMVHETHGSVVYGLAV